MFKLIALLSLLSVGSPRVIGSDPQTRSPNATPVVAPLDKCEACKMLAVKLNEQNIYIYEIEDPQMFCETMQVCKKRFWWF